MTARLLIVDDEALVREVLRLRLMHDGDYLCDEAASGREAIDLVKTNRYDLVITDMLMPDEDGLAIIQYLREQAPETHVFALSASANAQLLNQASQAGAERTFAKPFPLDDLADAVRDTLVIEPS